LISLFEFNLLIPYVLESLNIRELSLSEETVLFRELMNWNTQIFTSLIRNIYPKK